MTFAPPTLLELRAYLAPITGLGPASLGIVGDTAHLAKGTSYHLGRDQLTSDAYSRQTARDKAGLTNAASAIDIGNYAGLRALSLALVKACQSDATRDIREVIYSPDGVAVLRWDRERGVASKPVALASTTLNNAHRTHTHVSYYRDSEQRDKVAVFRAITGDDMVKFTPGVDVAGTLTVIRDTAGIPIEGGDRPTVRAGIARPALGLFTLDDLDDRPCYLMGVGAQLCFIAAADVTFVADAPALPHTVALTVDGQTVYSETLA